MGVVVFHWLPEGVPLMFHLLQTDRQRQYESDRSVHLKNQKEKLGEKIKREADEIKRVEVCVN